MAGEYVARVVGELATAKEEIARLTAEVEKTKTWCNATVATRDQAIKRLTAEVAVLRETQANHDWYVKRNEWLNGRIDELTAEVAEAKRENEAIKADVIYACERAVKHMDDNTRLREALETLHGLVEDAANGWAGALPHGPNVSTLVKQDRLTAHDIKRRADAVLHPPAPALDSRHPSLWCPCEECQTAPADHMDPMIGGVSPAKQEAAMRQPLPPADMVSALQDKVHKDLPGARPAKSVKAPTEGQA